MDNLEQGYKGVDRRKFPRLNARVRYKIVEDNFGGKAGNTKNISAGGIAFFAKDKIELNSVLSLSISLPDSTDFQAKAQVVWYDSVEVSWDPEISYEWGVKFIEIDEESRKKISKYVFLRLDKN